VAVLRLATASGPFETKLCIVQEADAALASGEECVGFESLHRAGTVLVVLTAWWCERMDASVGVAVRVLRPTLYGCD